MERSLGVFLLLVLLATTASEIGGVEGRTCESLSNRFKGACVRSSNCASVCQVEGFPSGDCKGLRRRCFCTKPC